LALSLLHDPRLLWVIVRAEVFAAPPPVSPIHHSITAVKESTPMPKLEHLLEDALAIA